MAIPRSPGSVMANLVLDISSGRSSVQIRLSAGRFKANWVTEIPLNVPNSNTFPAPAFFMRRMRLAVSIIEMDA